jgi:low temperature requirement protein LtrA
MKFDNSNIVERMGALTLIIMGEGIIGLTEQVSLILKMSATISASTLGLVIAAVLIIYVLWMLYFDHTDVLDHPGARINKQKPWCQYWAFLHFPLHTFIVECKRSPQFPFLQFRHELELLAICAKR